MKIIEDRKVKNCAYSCRNGFTKWRWWTIAFINDCKNLVTNSLEIKAITDICTTRHPMKTYTRWSHLLFETEPESSPSWDPGDEFYLGSYPSKGQATENKFMIWRADHQTMYNILHNENINPFQTDLWTFVMECSQNPNSMRKYGSVLG